MKRKIWQVHNIILLSHKKQWNPAISNDMNRTRNRYVNQNNQNKKYLNEVTAVKCKKGWSHVSSQQNDSYRGQGLGKREMWDG